MVQPNFEKCPVVPVVVIKSIEETIPTLQALMDGGVPVAEITFRTACAADAIREGVKNFPEMNIGAGTTINGKQAKQAVEAGAQFIVSPGVTPTEIMQALELGITTVKFFPANVYGGLSALKTLAGPFPQVRFLPTGGVDLSNLNEFLAFEKIAAVGGSFMMKGDIVANCKKIRETIGK